MWSLWPLLQINQKMENAESEDSVILEDKPPPQTIQECLQLLSTEAKGDFFFLPDSFFLKYFSTTFINLRDVSCNSNMIYIAFF